VSSAFRKAFGVLWRRHEQHYVDRVARTVERKIATGKVSTFKELHDETVTALVRCASFPLSRSARFTAVAQEAVSHVIRMVAGQLTESVLSRPAAVVAEDRRAHDDLRMAIHARWGKAIDLLELLRLICLEAGPDLHARHDPGEDVVYPVLVRLHARACLLTGEVVALLKAGYAAGAHARWRSLHEVVVVGAFIAQQGQEIACRYVEHEYVDQYYGAHEYQRHARRLGEVPFSEEEMSAIEAERQRLVDAYGKDFEAPYGWASAVLGARPTFSRIERSVELAHWRPYYRMASHATHAGPKGVAFNLGLMRNEVMLAGPSNAGLADPGQSTAMSLAHLTAILLAHDPALGDVVASAFAVGLVDPVTDAFTAAHERLERDEAAARAAGRDQRATE
jgi:hypothetical protein